MKFATKLSISFSAGITIFLVLFCSVTLYFFRGSLIDEFDRTLKERFAYLQRHLELNADGSVYFRGSDYSNQVKIKGVSEPVYVEVWKRGEGLIFKNTDIALQASGNGTILSFSTASGQKLRMIEKPVSEELTIRAAFDESRITSRVAQLFWLFALLIPYWASCCRWNERFLFQKKHCARSRL